MAQGMMTFNVHHGCFEAIIHGYKNGFLTNEDYNGLTQCDSLDDIKSQLEVTDYHGFMQGESATGVTSRMIAEKATEKIVSDFLELREWADQPLARFLDFMSYDAMISNVLKVVAAKRHGRESLDILYKCHPLGLFDGIETLVACEDINEMLAIVLIDCPIGQFFVKPSKREFDEVSIEYLRAVLQRNYIEAFYDFCAGLGGETADVMTTVLGFEADRTVLTIVSNTLSMKDMITEDREKLFPRVGTLVPLHAALGKVKTVEELVAVLRGGFPEFADLFEERAGGGLAVGTEKKGLGIERKLLLRAVEVYQTAMMRQFQFGSFYGWLKLKELEIQNIVWIGECIVQGQKTRVHDYIQIVPTQIAA